MNSKAEINQFRRDVADMLVRQAERLQGTEPRFYGTTPVASAQSLDSETTGGPMNLNDAKTMIRMAISQLETAEGEVDFLLSDDCRSDVMDDVGLVVALGCTEAAHSIIAKIIGKKNESTTVPESPQAVA